MANMENSAIGPMLNAVTWGGAVVAGAGALTLADWMAVSGVFLALLGLVVNWWHKRALVRIARERLELERVKRAVV